MRDTCPDHTPDSKNQRTSCAVLRAYSSADSRLRGMHLTPLRLRLLRSDLPPLQRPQLKGFLFSSVVFQSYIRALHFIRNQFESNYWEKNLTPKNLGIVYSFNFGCFTLLLSGYNPKHDTLHCSRTLLAQRPRRAQPLKRVTSEESEQRLGRLFRTIFCAKRA